MAGRARYCVPGIRMMQLGVWAFDVDKTAGRAVAEGDTYIRRTAFAFSSSSFFFCFNWFSFLKRFHHVAEAMTANKNSQSGIIWIEETLDSCELPCPFRLTLSICLAMAVSSADCGRSHHDTRQK